MTTPGESDLIGMAEIARLAGQSRSTVGNWKTRYADSFPSEKGRSKRGPLYDRGEIVTWLAERFSRTATASSVEQQAWELLNMTREVTRPLDAMVTILVLLAESPPGADGAGREQLLADLRNIDVEATQKIETLLPEIEPIAAPYLEQVRNAESAPAFANWLISKASESERFDATPGSLAKLMAGLLGPVGRLYDPCVGLGVLSAAAIPRSELEVIGQDVHPLAVIIARLNLGIHGIRNDLRVGDVVASDLHPSELCDGVLMAPPFGMRFGEELDLNDVRWRFGEPQSNSGDLVWPQIGLHHLTTDGRMVTTVAPGTLFNSGHIGRIRQQIIRADVLDAVITLPSWILPTTGLAPAILVFDVSRPALATAPGPQPILLIDGGKLLETSGDRRIRRLTPDSIDAVLDIYWSWKRTGTADAESTVAATYDQLATNEFILSPGRYAQLEDVGDYDQLLEERNRLVEMVKTKHEAVNFADHTLYTKMRTKK